jgi:hypothetical protein
MNRIVKRPPEYAIWKGMRSRCHCPGDTNYRYYGARGIRVCARWDSFADFLADMGPRPTPLHSIDRIDSNGDYEPDNCRWALRRDQLRNRRSNVLIELNGETKCITDWCVHFGISITTVYTRLSRGWSLEDALNTPPTPGFAERFQSTDSQRSFA